MQDDPFSVAKYLTHEWEVISKAPFMFIASVLLLVGLVWGAFHWRYRGKVERLESAIEGLESDKARIASDIDRLKEEKATLSTQLSVRSLPPKAVRFSKNWLKLDSYRLWQAAWLWVGVEPKDKIPPGSAAYPILQMLKD